ncbi:MAG: hypothetical protein LBT13_05065 [Treponema sp.]|jgi:hypothetical protein|nr:hypothetical protein [Treponema sp.]
MTREERKAIRADEKAEMEWLLAVKRYVSAKLFAMSSAEMIEYLDKSTAEIRKQYHLKTPGEDERI